MSDSIVSKLTRRIFGTIDKAEQRAPPVGTPVYMSEIGQTGYYSSMQTKQQILAPIISRISTDVSSVVIKHVLVNEDNQLIRTVDSGLSNALQFRANEDQTGRDLLHQATSTLLEHGHCVIIPTVAIGDPRTMVMSDVHELRIGRSLESWQGWLHLEVFNPNKGSNVVANYEKHVVAVVYNPLAAVMNNPNSTLQRLLQKQTTLDTSDSRLNSKALDIIIQTEYPLMGETNTQRAKARAIDLENQLASTSYGIGYIGPTEKITQLNRPAKHDLPEQIKWLKEMLYSELGLSPGVFNGSASETEMLSYYNRTVYPIVSAIIDSMSVKFFTKASRTRGHRLKMIPNLFKMAPVTAIGDVTDKFLRNEVFTANEIRSELGYARKEDGKADELANPHIRDRKEGEINEQKT